MNKQHDWAYSGGTKYQILIEEKDAILTGLQKMNKINLWSLGIH